MPAARSRSDVVAALVLLAASAAIAVWALVLARGEVALGGGSHATEFISPWWWWAFLLAPVPALAGRTRAAATTLLAALVAPHVVAAAVCVGRYRSSGWGSGLEVLAFLHPVLLALVGGALVGVLRRRG